MSATPDDWLIRRAAARAQGSARPAQPVRDSARIAAVHQAVGHALQRDGASPAVSGRAGCVGVRYELVTRLGDAVAVQERRSLLGRKPSRSAAERASDDRRRGGVVDLERGHTPRRRGAPRPVAGGAPEGSRSVFGKRKEGSPWMARGASASAKTAATGIGASSAAARTATATASVSVTSDGT